MTDPLSLKVSAAVSLYAQAWRDFLFSFVFVGRCGADSMDPYRIRCGLFSFMINPLTFFLDNYEIRAAFDGKDVTMGVWDTAGSDEYYRLRPLNYPQTDVVVYCYAVDDAKSVSRLESTWYPELNRCACPDL